MRAITIGYSKAQQIGKQLIPKMGKRTEINDRERKKAKEMFGEHCNICGDHNIQLHHIIYASKLGKGKWRNLVPLCDTHHKQVHDEPRKGLGIKNKREGKYGPHYMCDEYDLFKMGLIQNPTHKEFEEYMKSEEFPF